MKLHLKISFIILISAFFVQPVQGQRLLRKIQEKIEEKVEEKAEEKMDEAIDKEFDKIDESMQSDSGDTKNSSKSDKNNEQRMQNIMRGLSMSGEPIPFEDSYTFETLVEMQVESYDKKGKIESEGQFITLLNPNSKSMAYQVVSGDMGDSGQGMFIIDAENGATIILNEDKGEKTGIVYGMGAFFSSLGESLEDENLDETPEDYLNNPNVKKTGRTKTIAGYKCEEYVYVDEESESEVWITTEMKMNTQDFFSTLFKTNLYSRGIPWGYLMEATTTEKSGEKSFMQVKRVETNLNTRFDLDEYEVTNLGSFTMPTGEK
ncbi:MAG: DUF4412 domain-containing protein [Bacteroidales bacterium]|nr:DUF4412 domain-containing protein [Bacteroidales bacterium]